MQFVILGNQTTEAIKPASIKKKYTKGIVLGPRKGSCQNGSFYSRKTTCLNYLVI